MKRIIFDTDLKDLAGDDLALAYAIKSGRADLSGVTTVRGNVGYGAKVAKKYLNLGGYGDVPVFTGSEKLFDGSAPESSYSIRGVLTAEEELDEPSVYGIQNNAPEFIIDSVRQRDHVIVATGPLTNVARALELYPKLSDQTEVVVADYNMNFDVPAARAVLSSGIPVTVIQIGGHSVSLLDYNLNFVGVDELMEHVNCKLGFNRHFFAEDHPMVGLNSVSISSDPLTVAAVLNPDLVQAKNDKVCTREGEVYQVKLVKQVDIEGFRREFLDTLSKKPQDVYKDESANIVTRARAAIALGMPNEALELFEENGKPMPPELYIAAAERFVPRVAFGESVKWYSKLLSSGAQVDRNRVKERLKAIGDKLVLRGDDEEAGVCYRLLS